MIARPLHSYSTNTLSELELDGYCDFGFPILAHAGVAEVWGEGVALHRVSSKGAATLPRVSSSKLDLKSSRLDEVIRTFAKVMSYDDDGRAVIDMAKLLKAIRAHLELMRSGGAALCLVAKDLEGNLRKAEQLYKRHPQKCATLSSMLELERDSDIHDGNKLADPSAAVGLLWIRRSLDFQAALYSSLARPDGPSPRDAARDAYDARLSPFHGWMLRTLFPASFLKMPQREVFLSKFGEVTPEELDEGTERKVERKLRALVGTLDPLLGEWRGCFERLDLEDERRV